MPSYIIKNGTLTLRELMEAFASSAIDPDAPVLMGVSEWDKTSLLSVVSVKLHKDSGAVILDCSAGDNGPCGSDLDPADELIEIL
jgi:hypothetical protein